MKILFSKILKKNIFILTIFFIIVFQSLLYANNAQKTKFRYFKWTVKEVSVGQLISISFFSGLLVSTLLNTTMVSFKKINFENTDENYEPLSNEEEMESNIEMPPQRDIRDSRPTISVNYRVVKNAEEYNFKRDQNYTNNLDNNDDWANEDNDW